MSKTLILGGARSGKSRYALEFGESLSEDRVFVATAQGFDEGMRERIARGIGRIGMCRGGRWRSWWRFGM